MSQKLTEGSVSYKAEFVLCLVRENDSEVGFQRVSGKPQ